MGMKRFALLLLPLAFLSPAPLHAASIARAAALMRSLPLVQGPAAAVAGKMAGFLDPARLDRLAALDVRTAAELAEALKDPEKARALEAAVADKPALWGVKNKLETISPVLAALPDSADDAAVAAAAAAALAEFDESVDDATAKFLDRYLTIRKEAMAVRKNYDFELKIHMARYAPFLSEARRRRYDEIKGHIEYLAMDRRGAELTGRQEREAAGSLERLTAELQAAARPREQMEADEREQDRRGKLIDDLTRSWDAVREDLETLLKNDSEAGGDSVERLQLARIAGDIIADIGKSPESADAEVVLKLRRLLGSRLEELRSRGEGSDVFDRSLSGLERELPPAPPDFAEVAEQAASAISRLKEMNAELKPFDRLAYEAGRAAGLAERARAIQLDGFAGGPIDADEAGDVIAKIESALSDWFGAMGGLRTEVTQYKGFDSWILRIAFANAWRAALELFQAKFHVNMTLKLMKLRPNERPEEIKANYDAMIDELKNETAVFDRQVMGRYPNLAGELVFSRPPSQ